jgi:hypothetical protein
VAAALLWIILWSLVLLAVGIPVFGRSPEQSEILRQRSLRMGQARYVIVQGILGAGFTSGLVIAVSDLVSRPSDGWIARPLL